LSWGPIHKSGYKPLRIAVLLKANAYKGLNPNPAPKLQPEIALDLDV